MRVASLSIAACLLVGCSASQAKKTRRRAELGIGASLVGVIGGSLGIAAFPDHKPVFIGITATFGGLAIASAVVYAIAHSNVPDDPPPPPPKQIPEGRDEAWQLTKQAQTAARAGDCATVMELDVRVRELDLELHATAFARDVAIARCLTPVPTREPQPSR